MSNRLTTAELIELTVDALCEEPADRETLELAHELIASGEGRALFDALFAAQGAQPNQLMTLLERTIDANVRVGTYLMARLLPVCGYAHEVFDGIDLWMDALREPEAAKALRVLASEKVGPALQARYERWAETIARRAAMPAAWLHAYVSRAQDLSPAFADHVRSVRATLESELKVQLRLGEDRNYSAGQVLEYQAADQSMRVQIWISSRAPLWTAVCLLATEPDTWSEVERDTAGTRADEFVGAVRAILASTALQEVSAAEQTVVMPNCATELDNTPANALQWFFTEIV